MNNEFRDGKDIDISPDQLWNSLGMFQQLIMFTIILIVYVAISLIIARSATVHEGLSKWLSSLNGLFKIDNIVRDCVFGIIAGIAAVVFTTLLDTGVALIAKENLREWMHRTDHLLPQTRIQKRWAWLITITGSVQEEIMFRGFIFLALLPIWSNWIWAALIMSAFFSLLHAGVQGFWSTVWIYMISIFLCAIIALGGSIYFVMLTHITINVCNLFVIPLFFNNSKK